MSMGVAFPRAAPHGVWLRRRRARRGALPLTEVHYGDGSGDAIGCPSGAAPRIELRLDGSGKLSGAALRAAMVRAISAVFGR